MNVPTVSISRILNAPKTPRCSDSNVFNVLKNNTSLFFRQCNDLITLRLVLQFNLLFHFIFSNRSLVLFLFRGFYVVSTCP